MPQKRRQWQKEEQLLALWLYNCLPFGQLDKRTPSIIDVAKAIDRTPSAVAMKACNFASLDPALDRKGLGNASQADKALWQAFMNDSEAIATMAETLYEQITNSATPDPRLPKPIETESMSMIKTRKVQSFFRRSVLVSYENRCAITGLSDKRLLIASHIIPWKDDEKRRADPSNGIALNPLHDKLFDKGLLSFDEDYRVILSNTLKDPAIIDAKYQSLMNCGGEQLRLPNRYQPDPLALRYHREKIFVDQPVS